MTKIATCCYCGSRAALVLTGRVRHELACATCGAPLSRLKSLPVASGRAPAPAATPARPTTHRARPPKAPKSRRLGRRVLSEVWDILDDIFD